MNHIDVARIVVIADGHGEVIERRHPGPIFGLESGQLFRGCVYRLGYRCLGR